MLNKRVNILNFFVEARIYKLKGVNEYYGDLSFSYKTLKRYLSTFNSIVLVCRVQEKKIVDKNRFHRIDDKNVTVYELPHYVGLLEFMSVKSETITRISNLILNSNILNNYFLCRLPGNVGNIACSILRENNLSYGVEVVGDPWDVFAPKSIQHPLRILLRYWFTYLLKKNVKYSKTVLYVTKHTLQKRYPSSPNSFTTYASNVALNFDMALEPKKHQEKKKFTIVSIGSLDQMYKGPDILLKSLAICKIRNLNFEFLWLGDGSFKDQMINLALKLNLDSHVSFIGNVKTQKLISILKRSDLFVLASKTEGLPRAMIEAMSQGIPCIGTNVGGIPELLDCGVLVEPNDIEQLANRIMDFLNSKELYDNQALKCLENSNDYLPEILTARRHNFYNSLITQA